MIKFFLPLTLSLLIISCTNTQQQNLSYTQKLEDFEYLCNYFNTNSPFQDLNRKKYSVPHLDSVYDFYSNILENSADDTSFVQIIQAVIELGGLSGHSGILFDSEIKNNKYGNLFSLNPLNLSLKDFSRGTYWSNLFYSLNYFCHAPFEIKRIDNDYFVNTEWNDTIKNIFIPINSKIVSINGLDGKSFMDSTIKNSWMNYYVNNREWVRDWLFIIDEGTSHKGWVVEFESNGDVTEYFVPKIKGRRSEPVENAASVENCVCLALNENIGYIKVRGFVNYSSRLYRKDKRKIKNFFEQNAYRFDKLFIDLRGNGGGDPRYGYELLIKPFLKETKLVEYISGFTKEYIVNVSERELNYYKLFKGGILDGRFNAVPIEKPEEFHDSDFEFFKTVKEFKTKKPYPFDGEIIVLIDNRVFSAAEDFATTFRRLEMGKLAGQTTAGGAAGFVSSSIVKLPHSGILVLIETELMLNPDNTINQVFRTEPDVFIENNSLPNSLNPKEIILTLERTGLLNK